MQPPQRLKSCLGRPPELIAGRSAAGFRAGGSRPPRSYPATLTSIFARSFITSHRFSSSRNRSITLAMVSGLVSPASRAVISASVGNLFSPPIGAHHTAMDDSRYEKEQLVAGVFHAMRARNKRPLNAAEQRLADVVMADWRRRMRRDTDPT